MTPNEMIKECLDINLCRAANATGKRLMSNFRNYYRVRISLARLAIALSALLLACLFVPPFASAEVSATQQVFPSPGAAASALVAAGKADDVNTLSSGPRSGSGPFIGRSSRRRQRSQRLRAPLSGNASARLRRGGCVILYVGAANWPVPIPLVKKNGGWGLDTAAGKEELLYRRVGRNELFTINVLEDLADARAEYASEAHDGERTGQFAQKSLSDTGKRNGLSWETELFSNVVDRPVMIRRLPQVDGQLTE
jgi:Protein of unknown function (DUF2950)